MLPDYPVAKDRLRKILESEFHKARQFDSLGISEEWIEEGDMHEVRRADGSVDATEFQCQRSAIEILAEECLYLTWLDVIQRVHEAGRELGACQTLWTLEQVKRATSAVGNYIDAAGKFSIEHIFELFEKLVVPFTPQGEPIFPEFYVGENASKELQEKMSQICNDPIHRARFETLMVAKREQWRDRENNRRLVD